MVVQNLSKFFGNSLTRIAVWVYVMNVIAVHIHRHIILFVQVYQQTAGADEGSSVWGGSQTPTS